MTEQLLVTKRTTPSMIDFARTLILEWPEATKEGAGVLWAHFAGETGSGQYCFNWNLGNVKHSKGDGFDYVSLNGVWEGFTIKDEDQDGDADADDAVILKTRLVRSGMWIEDPSKDHDAAVGKMKVSMIATSANIASWFRAYPDLETGMRHFINMKRNQGGRYASAWAFVVAGNPEEYGRELGRKGYYTASQDAYARSMRSRFDAWMRTTAFEEAEDTVNRLPEPSPIPPSMVVSSPEHAITHTTSDLIPVVLDGVTWLVSPIQYAPIGIGQAMTLATTLGYELPTPELVDAIWSAADLKVPPHLMIRSHDGIHMNTPGLLDEETRALAAFIGPRNRGVDYQMIAGAFKDVVMINGKPGLYGWNTDDAGAASLHTKGVPVHASKDGKSWVVQPPFTGHALGWIDYSQGLRLVKRAA